LLSPIFYFLLCWATEPKRGSSFPSKMTWT
jgi:hypothetical protein